MSHKRRQAGIHIQHYLPLFSLLIFGGLGFVYFSYDKVFQAVIALATAAGYFVWGIVHHHIHRDLHLSVILEYFAIAALGIAVVFSLLFRV